MRSEVRRQVKALLAEQFGFGGSMGGLAWHAGRVGMVCHFDHEGKLRGAEANWVLSAGNGYGPEDVATICRLFVRLFRYYEVGEDN